MTVEALTYTEIAQIERKTHCCDIFWSADCNAKLTEKSENQVTNKADEVNLFQGFSEDAFEAANRIIAAVSVALAESFNNRQMRRALMLSFQCYGTRCDSRGLCEQYEFLVKSEAS